MKYLRSCPAFCRSPPFDTATSMGIFTKLRMPMIVCVLTKGIFVSLSWCGLPFSSRLEFLMNKEIFSNSISYRSAHWNFDKIQAFLPSIIDRGLNPVLVVYTCLQLLGVHGCDIICQTFCVGWKLMSSVHFIQAFCQNSDWSCEFLEVLGTGS